jgi:uncharacterized membrane protein YagU involved in acid resistance
MSADVRTATEPTATEAVSHLRGAVVGGVAGAAGGLVFGASMAVTGMLPTIASIVRTDSEAAGFGVHMVFAVLIGAAFGLLVVRLRLRVREMLFWGQAYGALWWFLGPQTLLPLFRGLPVDWGTPEAGALLPSLIGHLFYGTTTALVLVLHQHDLRTTWRVPPAGAVLRGAVAGIAAATVLYWVPASPRDTLAWLLTGIAVGACYPLLFSARPEPTGPALARGTLYGFAAWVVVDLTLRPLVADGGLAWSQPDAAAAAGHLPGYLLLGVGTAVGTTWLGLWVRGLFLDDVRKIDSGPPGARGPRAVAFGTLSGLVGGLLFTAVMVLVGALPLVANVVGADGAPAGLVVHLVISAVIGVSYALLFRRQSFDVLSGIGWGVSYGFFWWVLGDLTLLPALTGAPIVWDAATLAAEFPSLVGHLAYGAALGGVYYRLEAGIDPWWVTRSDLEASRVAARREQVLSAAPAIWALTTVIAVTLPILTAT